MLICPDRHFSSFAVGAIWHSIFRHYLLAPLKSTATALGLVVKELPIYSVGTLLQIGGYLAKSRGVHKVFAVQGVTPLNLVAGRGLVQLLVAY
jgi:hypothetical protein